MRTRPRQVQAALAKRPARLARHKTAASAPCLLGDEHLCGAIGVHADASRLGVPPKGDGVGDGGLLDAGGVGQREGVVDLREEGDALGAGWERLGVGSGVGAGGSLGRQLLHTPQGTAWQIWCWLQETTAAALTE